MLNRKQILAFPDGKTMVIANMWLENQPTKNSGKLVPVYVWGNKPHRMFSVGETVDNDMEFGQYSMFDKSHIDEGGEIKIGIEGQWRAEILKVVE